MPSNTKTLSTQKHNSHLKEYKEIIYSGTKHESPWPRNTDLGFPKFHVSRSVFMKF